MTDADDSLLSLPFYLVVDVSFSMTDEDTIGAVNDMLPTIVDGIAASPTLADVVRLGLVDFSDDASVVLRLDDVRKVNGLPMLAVRGGTSYVSAFRLLRKEIDVDMQQLKGDGYKVYRPVVFFITDGAPTDSQDELTRAFAELTDPGFRFRPNIIPFGVGGATKEAVDPWVHPHGTGTKKGMRSYVASPEVNPAAAINQLAGVLLNSIMASGMSVQAEGTSGGFVAPDEDDLDDDMWL